MQRQASFGSNYALDEALEEPESPYVVYLRKEGEFLNKNQSPLEGGKLVSIWNYPLRNKLWPMVYTDFHPKQHAFAVADERGQVFHFSMKQRDYHSVKLASTSVSAISYLQHVKDALVIAYDNLTNVIINTKTKEIMGNIQLTGSKGKVLLIRPHPYKPILLLYTSDNVVSLWDLSTNQCLQTLDCQDRLIDITYECQGDIFMIGLEKTGIFVYELATLQLIHHIPIASVVGNERCLCYTTIPYSIVKPAGGDSSNSKKPLSVYYYNLLVGTSDNALYSWLLTFQDRHRLPSTSTKSKKDESAMSWQVNSGLFGKFVLPTTQSQYSHHNYPLNGPVPSPLIAPIVISALPAMSKTSSGVSNHYPRVFVMLSSGQVYLLQLEGFHVKSAGYFKILANLPSLAVMNDHPVNSSYPLQPGNPADLAPIGMNAHFETRFEKQIYHGLVGFDKDHLVILGWDGAVRLFAIQAMYSSGYLVGNVLQFDQVSLSPRVSHSVQMITNDVTQSKKQAHEQNYYEFYLSDHENDGHEGEEERKAGKSQHKTTKTTPASISKGKNTSNTSRSSISTNTVHRQSPSATRNSVLSSATTTARAKESKFVPSFVVGKATKANHMVNAGGKQFKRLKSGQLQVVEHASEACALYELNALTPKDMQINVGKLKAYLKKYDEYPEQYRGLIWRFLLKLPENVDAFQELVNRGVHPAARKTMDEYPMSSRKFALKMTSLLSILYHWTPVLIEAKYLPSLVFPFMLLYPQDDLTVIETIMSVMMYWGYAWHVNHPLPPVHLIDWYNTTLLQHDGQLHSHLVKQDLSVGIVCFELLSTLCTGILPRDVWYGLIDTLLTQFRDMVWCYLVPIAVLKAVKTLILACDTGQQIVQQVLQHQQNVTLAGLKTSVATMKARMNDNQLAALATRWAGPNQVDLGGRKRHTSESRSSPDGGLPEQSEAQLNMALAQGLPKHPLLKGDQYLVYDGIPLEIRDLQLSTRSKLLQYEEEVAQQHSVLVQLQSKVKQLGITTGTTVPSGAVGASTGGVSVSGAQSVSSKTTTNGQSTIEVGKDGLPIPPDLRHHPSLLPLTSQHAFVQDECQALQSLVSIQQEVAKQQLTLQQAFETTQSQQSNEQQRLHEVIQQVLQQTEQTVKQKQALVAEYAQYAQYTQTLAQQQVLQEHQQRMIQQRDQWLQDLAQYVGQTQDKLLDTQSQLAKQWAAEDVASKQQLVEQQVTWQQLAQQEEFAQLQGTVEAQLRQVAGAQDQALRHVQQQRLKGQQQVLVQQLEDVQGNLMLMMQKYQLLTGGGLSGNIPGNVVNNPSGKVPMKVAGMGLAGDVNDMEDEDVDKLQENVQRLQKQYQQLVTQQQVLHSKLLEQYHPNPPDNSNNHPNSKHINRKQQSASLQQQPIQSMSMPPSVPFPPPAPTMRMMPPQQSMSSTMPTMSFTAAPTSMPAPPTFINNKSSSTKKEGPKIVPMDKDVELTQRMNYEFTRALSSPSRPPPNVAPPIPSKPHHNNNHHHQQAQPLPASPHTTVTTANEKVQRKTKTFLTSYGSDTDHSVMEPPSKPSNNARRNSNSNMMDMAPQWQSNQPAPFAHTMNNSNNNTKKNAQPTPAVPLSATIQPVSKPKHKDSTSNMSNNIDTSHQHHHHNHNQHERKRSTSSFSSVDNSEVTEEEEEEVHAFSASRDLFAPSSSHNATKHSKKSQNNNSSSNRNSNILVPNADDRDAEFLDAFIPPLPSATSAAGARATAEAIHEASQKLSFGQQQPTNTMTSLMASSSMSMRKGLVDIGPLDIPALPPTLSTTTHSASHNNNLAWATSSSPSNYQQAVNAKQYASLTSPKKLLYRTKSSDSFRQSFYGGSGIKESSDKGGASTATGTGTNSAAASPINKNITFASQPPPRKSDRMTTKKTLSSDFTIDSDSALWAFEKSSRSSASNSPPDQP